MHSTGMDCETESLESGPPPYVCALYDTRHQRPSHFILDPADPQAHILRATQAMQNAPNLVSFNGTQFDFRMLAAAVDHPSDKARLARLALSHCDIMLQFACENGYFSSLNSFAVPTLDHPKIGCGADVHEQWQAGKHQEVADYCADDARITAELYNHGAHYGHLLRTPKSKPDAVRRYALPPALWQPAHVCLRNPRQATFMETPPNVAGMADWTLEHL